MKQLYEISLKARELFKDNFYNKLILTEAKKVENSCIDLRIFIEMAKNIKSTNGDSENEIFNVLNQLVNNVDLTHRSTNPLRFGEVENYIPAFFVPNLEVANFSKLPIISSGISVLTSLPDCEQYEDYIVAWYSDIDGNFNEILINEEIAMNTTHPVIIVDNAEEELTKRNKIYYNDSNNKGYKNQNTAQYHTNEYRINHRYDNTNNSEFCITAALIRPDGSPNLVLRNSNGTVTDWKKIADVHKNDIGKQLSKWEQFCIENLVPFSSNFIFFNTYERDWEKSPKNLGFGSRNGGTIYLSGRMTYSNEWYAYSPSEVNNNPVDIDHIYWNWAKWHSNTKGNLRIWRVNP